MLSHSSSPTTMPSPLHVRIAQELDARDPSLPVLETSVGVSEDADLSDKRKRYVEDGSVVDVI